MTTACDIVEHFDAATTRLGSMLLSPAAIDEAFASEAEPYCLGATRGGAR
ncbi:hypothetical protein [Actinocrinis sp.]|nr:hypothetical protein [Actinocrinis sp.]